MRHIILFSFVLATVLPGLAADRVITVTPQNLADWVVTGTTKNAMASAGQLVLPAGAQMSQSFSDGTVILHLAARQVFSDQPDDWPIIGLGSAAVALIRKDGQGKLVLVVDATTATYLPWAVPLDPSHRQDPVELLLAYDPPSGVGLVSFQDQVQPFHLAPSTQPAEVWLSAGAKSNWSLERLQVIVLDPSADASVTAGKQGATGASTAKPTTADKLQAALEKLRAMSSGAGVTGPSTVSSASAVDPGSRLEVFTPPSVRRTQVVNAVGARLPKPKLNKGRTHHEKNSLPLALPHHPVAGGQPGALHREHGFLVQDRWHRQRQHHDV